MASVKFVSASRVYAKDAPPAVGALDLDIKDGEFMVLVGWIAQRSLVRGLSMGAIK